MKNALINAGKFALLLLLAGPSFGAIAVSTHTIMQNSAGGTITTPAINTTGANLLVAAVTALRATPYVMGDSLLNTWTPLTASANNGNEQVQLYYASNATVGAAQTFTATAANIFACLSVIAFSGATTTPFDQQNNNRATATSLTTGGITPTQNNEMVVTALGWNQAGLPVSINGGYTQTDSVDWFANGYGCSMAYALQTNSAFTNPTWTRTNSNDTGAAIASFQAPASTAGYLIFTP